MRLGTALLSGRQAVVVAGPNASVHDVSDRVGTDLAAALADGRAAELDERALGAEVASEQLEWLPPIPAPGRILCAGLNYRGHAGETEREVPSHPTFFVRWPSSLVGHDQPILRPAESETFDWEGEIAVVIGKGGRRIAAHDALGHVAGYVPFGDNTIREYQLHGTQVTAGKNFDRSGSWGQWLVTPDEAGDPRELEMRTVLNGVEVQHGRLADLVFGVAELIAYASTFTTLEPGDVIATGTPQGVGFRRAPPTYLRPGDELRVELVGHAGVANVVVDDQG